MAWNLLIKPEGSFPVLYPSVEKKGPFLVPNTLIPNPQSMLLVRTTIGESPIQGIGVFAAERIKKGTPIWEFTKDFDLEIPGESIQKLGSLMKETMLKYAYRMPKTNTYILPADDARFMNHSDHPVVLISQDDGPDTAARDIAPREELTADYSTFDADFTGFHQSK